MSKGNFCHYRKRENENFILIAVPYYSSSHCYSSSFSKNSSGNAHRERYAATHLGLSLNIVDVNDKNRCAGASRDHLRFYGSRQFEPMVNRRSRDAPAHLFLSFTSTMLSG